MLECNASIKTRTSYRFFWCVILFIAVFALWQKPLHAMRMVDQVKGVFLYNFIHFVQWQKQPETPTICLTASKGFMHVMGHIAEEKNKGDVAEFELRYINQLNEDISDCAIFYLNKANAQAWYKLQAGKTLGTTLLVTDDEALFDQYADVYLYERQGRIRLKVHYTRIQKRKIRLSAKLLRLAEEVR